MSQQDITHFCEQFQAEYEQLQRLLHVPTLEAEHYALARVCQQRMVSYHQQLQQLVGSDDAENLLSVVRWWVIERERKQQRSRWFKQWIAKVQLKFWSTNAIERIG